MKPDSQRADRAFGAMILAFFGAAWLEAWCWFAQRGHVVVFALIAVVAIAILVLAWRLHRANTIVPAPPQTAQQRRTSRAFHIINAGQWIAILIGINVLNNVGLGRWDLPLAISIVGLHFLALGPVFQRGAHYVTGAAMLVLAGAYPFLVAQGPTSPVGALGTGLILWASALWALRPRSPGSG